MTAVRPRRGRRRWIRRVLWLAAISGIVGLVAAYAWPRGDPRRLWDRAILAFEAGNYDEAEAALARLAWVRTPTALDSGLRARLAIVRGKTDEALAALARIPDEHALATWARLRAGQLELRRHRLRAAEAGLRLALRLDPGLIQARRELIYIYALQLRRRELDEEFRVLAERSELTFQETWIWCMAPDLFWWVPQENAESLLRCLAADPDDRWSRLAIADDYRRLMRVGDAESLLSHLPASDPDARAARAQLALERGDLKATEVLLAEGPEAHPGLARLRGQRALARGDGREAVRHYRHVYAAEPDRRDSVYGLGRALLLAGDPEAARPFLKAVERHDALATLLLRAKDRAEADRKLLLDLAAACRAVDRLPEARTWYRLILRRDPLDREAQEAVDQLKRAEAGTSG